MERGNAKLIALLGSLGPLLYYAKSCFWSLFRKIGRTITKEGDCSLECSPLFSRIVFSILS